LEKQKARRWNIQRRAKEFRIEVLSNPFHVFATARC
jgi:hypothetical protein